MEVEKNKHLFFFAKVNMLFLSHPFGEEEAAENI